MAYFNAEFVDPSSLDTFDYSQSPSQDKGKARMLSQPSMPSPSTSVLPLDMVEGEPQRMQPSHNYEQYRQQVGIPMLGSAIPSYTAPLTDNLMYDTMAYPMSNYEITSPQDFKWESFLENDAMDTNTPPVMPTRVFPGMHQQMALEQQRTRQQQLQLEAEQEKRAQAASRRSVDQRTENTIHRVMSEIRRSSYVATDSFSPPSSVLPQVAKAKKDEEEMDEDERLLNSEEGKKLSSKERRQLRNKVSARAFRSRRKEYISQLEGELAQKVNEANDLKRSNLELMQENARYKALAEKLLAHPAFMPFMKDLSQDPALMETLNAAAASKDLDPYTNTSQFSQSNDVQIGMTLIPEMPVDLSALNLGHNNWAIPASRPPMSQYLQPQVFAVTEVPEPAEQIDFASLSGKANDELLSQLSEEESKSTYPELDTPSKQDTSMIPELPISQDVVEDASEEEFDESMALFTPVRSRRASSPSEILEPAAVNLKQNSIELLVVAENDTAIFGQLSARLDARMKRLEMLMSGL